MVFRRVNVCFASFGVKPLGITDTNYRMKHVFDSSVGYARLGKFPVPGDFRMPK